MHSVTVVTISTGDADLLSRGAVQALLSGMRLVLRTGRHPVARWLAAEGAAFETLDQLYDQAETFDRFNEEAARFILNAAETGDLVYAVADAMADSTVAAVRRQLSGGELHILPGVSHADRCMALAKAELPDVRITSAESFLAADDLNPRLSCFLTELHSRACAGACKVKLMQLLDDDTQVLFFYGDDAGGLQMREIPLYALDRQERYDHMTAFLYRSLPLEKRARFGMDDLLGVMLRLRSKDGCPWDREQTHESLLTNLLEESYEFIEAAREQDAAHMSEELGDVLLQIVFHAVIAAQCGEFTLHDVTTGITEKLIERHPHVFGNVKADTAEKVLDNWEQIKRRQRGIDSVSDAMAGVSKGLSAAMRAYKVQHKAAKVGFDFPDAESAMDKVGEESAEVLACLRGKQATEEELGDLLFSVVNVCRLCGVNPDIALSASADKFIRRFRGMEQRLKSEGKSIEDLTLSEMDVYWVKEKHISMRDKE